MTRLDPTNGDGAPKPQIKLMLATVFLAYSGQMTLNPVIAPLSREVGLAEWQVGFMISVAAVMVVLTSQFWGRRSQSWGRKPVMVSALAIATLAMTLFAVFAALGLRGLMAGTGLFMLFVATRGLLFGAAISALPPTAQAYIADATTSEEERIRGMAGVGTVQGVAMIAGAVFGAMMAGISLLLSIIAVPVLMLAGLLLVMTLLRRETPTELIQRPPRISPRDGRVWPFLLAGFCMFTALGLIQIAIGFLVQDRFTLNANATAMATGGALLLSGVGTVIAQAVVVPRSKWSPGTLLRVGTLIGVLGFAILLVDAGLWLLMVAVAIIGLGIGIAIPGYTAGPTLLMSRDEQGGLAGLIGATNGLTFVIAPTAGTSLYGVWALLPFIIGGGVLLGIHCFVLLHPRFRTLPNARPGETSSL